MVLILRQTWLAYASYTFDAWTFAGKVTPLRCIPSGRDTILYPCMCVMRYHDFAETNNAPILHLYMSKTGNNCRHRCECERLPLYMSKTGYNCHRRRESERLPLCMSKAGHNCRHRCDCVETPPVPSKVGHNAVADVGVWELLLYRQRLDTMPSQT